MYINLLGTSTLIAQLRPVWNMTIEILAAANRLASYRHHNRKVMTSKMQVSSLSDGPINLFGDSHSSQHNSVYFEIYGWNSSSAAHRLQAIESQHTSNDVENQLSHYLMAINLLRTHTLIAQLRAFWNIRLK